MPNLILSGPPGTGKTTSVLALARTLLGDSFKEGVLELNASDDRGIEVVRGRIKAFAQKKVTLPPGKHKIVVLDEADAMTEGAQQAMRRTMEIYSSTTRFALACNMSEKIIEPIQSRCAGAPPPWTLKGLEPPCRLAAPSARRLTACPVCHLSRLSSSALLEVDRPAGHQEVA